MIGRYSLALTSQPQCNVIVVHDIIGNQGCPIMDENDAPLQINADFIRSPRQFAQPQAAMLMWVAKSCSYFREGEGNFFAKVSRQLVRRFSDSFGKQDIDRRVPAKDSKVPASRESAISASAASSAMVA